MKSKFKWILIPLVLLLVSVAPLAVTSWSGKDRFDWVIAKQLTVTNDAEFYCDVYAEDSLDVGGDLSIAGAVDVAGSTVLEGPLVLGSAAHFTPTYTASTPSTWMLVPTATYYSIGSGGAVTMTLAITGVVDGQYLVIYGEDANTVTINDENLLSVGGSTLSLTQYDVGVFIYIEAVSKWAEISLAGNS